MKKGKTKIIKNNIKKFYEIPVPLPKQKEEKKSISEDYEKKLGFPVPISMEKKLEEETVKKEIKEEQEFRKGKLIVSYKIAANNVSTKVNIFDTEKGKFYYIKLPEVSKPTRALLETTKQKLITMIDIGTSEITDINIIEKLKENLKEKASSLLQKFKLPKENINFLSGLLINEMLGLGNIELLIADPNLEEIVITSAKEPVRVYHKEYGWMETNLLLESEKQIENYSAIIARRVGRQITTLTPMLDAHLITGDRVNAVLYPICTKGNTITIRKFAREPWTIVDFINNKTCNAEVFSLIWLAIQYEMNIIFSGGTASGKTTMLNVCTPFFPINHRIISIEDTRELQLPENLYWTPLVTRLPNPEGKGEVTMLDLLVNSLRMRPDRIILGEVRKHETAEVLFEAMHTGHSVYATLHADTAAETIARLVNPPISIAPNLLKAVDMNIVMFRDRRRGIRRVLQVAEFVPDESDKHGVKPNILYRWEPSTDKIIKHSESVRLLEDLSRYTGMSLSQINKDLAEKKAILEYLVKNNIREMNAIGEVIQNYYLKRNWKIKEKIKKKKVRT
ncbi:MAG: ATPase, T2SS/T4P/T4SS family [Candidatus Pacearchaeota archaeon]|nr:ATPase, T2SS/T4P/T4SS family [Candidatus Pacearchaeota archaeon]